MAIYIKQSFDVKLVLSESVGKELELLALETEVSRNHHIMLVGCYRPPVSSSNSLSTLVKLLSS